MPVETKAENQSGFRFFILGAGFSYPAGLPLASELWAEVYDRQRDNISASLDWYARFKDKCEGVRIDPNDEAFDFEDFVGFLDIEHWLWLQGGDTLSGEGNGAQLNIRREIGRVLTERTPTPDNIPDVYLEFARELKAHDYVLTFNYDTLLERALDKVGKKYRLFPDRLSSVDDISGIGYTADEFKEVAVLKMHGSVDWFSRTGHEESLRVCGGERPHAHPMFGLDANRTDAKYKALPILEGPQSRDDPLRHIWRVPEVADVESFYKSSCAAWLCTPWLLPPSTKKFVYLDKLLPFWRGLGKSGVWNLGLVVIGYSLPPHDDYAKITLFAMTENYQRGNWGKGAFGPKLGHKSPVVLIDRCTDGKAEREYRKRYGFVDPKKAKFHLSGFDSEAVELIRQARIASAQSAE